jgi:diguanylate cyclase (GGDEF)-like protein/PAS domain S-box-containing protein
MSARNAAPSAASTAPAGARNDSGPDDPGRRSPALALLDAYRRDNLLEAVAISARELLRSSDLALSLPRVAERIGHATGVDRTHILLIDAASGQGHVLQHFVWTIPGIHSPPDFVHAKTSMADIGLQSWIPRLKRGEILASHVCDLEPGPRAFFESGGVKSVLSVPVFSDDKWLGQIGFNDCHSERDWTAADIDTIKTVAELVGAAIARTTHLQKLDDANHIIENSATILYRVGPQPPYPLTFLSQNISRYGYQADELLAHPERWPQLVESADLPTVLGDSRTISSGEVASAHAEFRMHKPDGMIVWFDSTGTALRDDNGQLVAIEGILTDVTARKEAENALSFSHVMLTTAIESSPDAVIIVDANDHIIMFNRHFVELWGIAPETLRAGVDSPVLKAVASKMQDESGFLAKVRNLYAHPELQCNDELLLKDGRVIERSSGSLYGAQQNYLGRVWFFRDVTEKTRALEKVAMLARTDSLTGLPNRAAFLERLTLEFARAKRSGTGFAVHYIDLDHFKDVNDTLGHPVGDTLLRIVAERLGACVRETDMVSRFGGDEFAVLQNDVGVRADIECLAEKIGRVIATPCTIAGNELRTTASIGIVPYRADIPNIDSMMVKADLALYRAKGDGRDRFSFHVAELDERTRERMVLSDDLRHAVERGELELFYQPQVEIKSGSVIGLEALLRWNHPRRGMLLPSTFIAVAETTGSIVPIGEWVIGAVCRQIRAWSDHGIAPPVVAVNLSGAQIKLASQLDQIISRNLARYGVAPEQIELELTESVLIETTQRHNEAFKRLRQLGVRLVIDDFGTGYSSLDYLRAFNVSRLKIDRRFIKDVTENADDAAIVRATIGLARALGIEVIAEGVETTEQRNFLAAAGCKLAQGYLFGKAVPVAAAEELLRKNRQLVVV